ncbi:unnamed protein product [Lactuca saligna]|uniref:Uncharacterized protein n=1 Tax=Lactuca saligna TaxID=75948 RepID=A0AA36EER5_LACSI|nr:unnamed protein product [Lactuca saligna]
MASSRMARFVSEVAPPQFVSLMRRRTTKMLDTISEDEREVCMHEREAKIAAAVQYSSFSFGSSQQPQAASVLFQDPLHSLLISFCLLRSGVDFKICEADVLLSVYELDAFLFNKNNMF